MTGAAIGEILPYAVGVAISPIPIIAIILMLLAPDARGTSLGFLGGWLGGIVLALAVIIGLAEVTSIGGGDSSTDTTGKVQLVLGALLILAAGRQWRGRPQPGAAEKLPGWMHAIETFTPARGAALGFVLAAVNPKNLLLIAAGAVVIATGALSTGQATTTFVVFVVIAACSVTIPVVAYLVAAGRMRAPLDDLRLWLQHNNAAVMAVLLLVIGVALLGKGVAALSL
jgi:hypothetical protein